MGTVVFDAAKVGGFEAICELPPELALREAVPNLIRLAKDAAFLDTYIVPLLEECREATSWYVAHTCVGHDNSYSLQIFVWPSGSKTQIHDHTSWGAYYCVVGTVLEERYERLDDGSKRDHARLKKIWQLPWGSHDGVSTVLPGAGGIHRVGNPGTGTAISVHLYGPKLGEVDGRDYEPSHNYVCDRVEA